MKQEIKEQVEKIRKGEVPEGYKETKVGIIPDDWKNKKLIQIADYVDYRGKTPQKTNNGVYLVTAKNIKKGFIDYEVSKEFVSENKYMDIMSRGLPKLGDVLITTEAPVGNVAQIDKENIALAQRVIKYRGKEDEIDNTYMKFYFLGFKFQKEILIESTGGTVQGIKGSRLHKLKVSFPKVKEQQKIAEILSTWDKAINLKEKQISHSNEYKKGFMQKLLFKRVKSNILWNETQLRKCLIPTSYPVNKPSEPYYALGIRSHCKGTLVRHIEDPEKIAMDTLYEVKENELIVNITFAWEGAITLLSKKDEGKLVSHRFPTYNFNKEYTIPDYFKHLVKTKWFVFQLGLLSPGGAGRNRVLNKTDFLKLKVLLPSVEEQRKIADFLNSLDNEIDLLNKELNQFKEQKRGLMQLLLTGIIRVEVD